MTGAPPLCEPPSIRQECENAEGGEDQGRGLRGDLIADVRDPELTGSQLLTRERVRPWTLSNRTFVYWIVPVGVNAAGGLLLN